MMYASREYHCRELKLEHLRKIDKIKINKEFNTFANCIYFLKTSKKEKF
jgi:hypothetical protein